MEMKTYAYNHVDGADPIEADVYFEPGDSSGPPKPASMPNPPPRARAGRRLGQRRPGRAVLAVLPAVLLWARRADCSPDRKHALTIVAASSPTKVRAARDVLRSLGDEERREATHDLDSEDCFAISGTPSETEPWPYMLFGHHLCLHAFVLQQQMVIGPVFLGAEPSIWRILSGFDASLSLAQGRPPGIFNGLYDRDLSYLDEPSRSGSTAGPPSRAQMSNWWYELSQIQNQYCAVTQALVSRLEGLSEPTRRLAAWKNRLPSAYRPYGIILVPPENYSHAVLFHPRYFNFLRTVRLAATIMRQLQSGISDRTSLKPASSRTTNLIDNLIDNLINILIDILIDILLLPSENTSITMATRALVVGGTGGIGYAIARHLAAESTSSTVIISGRTQPQDVPHANMEFRHLDASSMRSIKQYTDAYKSAQHPKLDLLVLTQGILTTAGRTETPVEALDRKMALHYYGRQLLVRELAPVLSDDAKVLIVLDGTRGDPAHLHWDDLDLRANFTISNAAAHCISMTDGMFQAYARQEQATGGRRHFVHAYPGFVKTDIFGSLPWYLRAGARALSHVMGVTPDECAANLLRGTEEAAAAGAEDGRFWSCIDAKGNLVADKPAWTEDQIAKVEEHTWKVVDEAIKVSSS
ncbi:Oxidoreductase andH [Colletotrichum sidae]|uniref:Oxidoreductase andH n=1 Tax=Colletotrichum sidae TaxID=1347389 RepID=A0A4R8S7X2_9PEZI|nr:Oxidoreductase andH [Colletotrichum sidae]